MKKLIPALCLALCLSAAYSCKDKTAAGDQSATDSISVVDTLAEQALADSIARADSIAKAEIAASVPSYKDVDKFWWHGHNKKLLEKYGLKKLHYAEEQEGMFLCSVYVYGRNASIKVKSMWEYNFTPTGPHAIVITQDLTNDNWENVYFSDKSDRDKFYADYMAHKKDYPSSFKGKEKEWYYVSFHA